MKAFVCRAFDGIEALEFCDAPRPQPAEGQMCVRVHACGVNFPDVLITEGKYQVRPALPFSPGGEVAGQVIAVGRGVDTAWLGARVTALSIYGGYAEETAIDVAAAVRIPESMSYAAAAGGYVANATAWLALVERGKLSAGETLMVTGASGAVGAAAIRIGRLVDAHVVAITSDAERARFCRAQGAHSAVYAGPDQDLGRVLSGLPLAHVALDVVGGGLTAALAGRLRTGGRIAVLGFASGEIAFAPIEALVAREATLMGVFLGGLLRQAPGRYHAIMDRLSEQFRSGELSPGVEAEVPWREAIQVLRDVKARGRPGKTVLLVD